MKLPVRPSPYILPSYSLTGDLLNFMRCGLQYRYYNVGKLPSSSPVQLWFGQFIHGVMEESYRRYNELKKNGTNHLPPWKDNELDEIIKLIRDRLTLQGLVPWNDVVEDIGIKRAKIAVNELGPDLFPIIEYAEVRLNGARDLALPAMYKLIEADKYEVKGVVDVITDVQLNNPELKGNKIVKAILEAINVQVPDEFEVIVDYKGMRRPAFNIAPTSGTSKHSLWEQYKWQVQTYAHLRGKQTDKPIVAGVLVYINELLPSKTDMQKLKREVKNGSTDVMAVAGSEDEKLIKEWTSKNDVPTLSYEYRLKRALRIIPIDEQAIDIALNSFDKVVERIEICKAKEHMSSNIIRSWEKDGSDESTCTACDAKTFCPDSPENGTPKLPGWKV